MSATTTSKPSQRLDKEDWLKAALDAIGQRGLEGVAVEPLARALGVTKGSFYWHFADRDALLAATLEFWRVRESERGIESLRKILDPRERLSVLFSVVFTRRDRGVVMSNLQASVNDPRVAPTLRAVAEARLRFLAETYADMGFPEPTAWVRAVHAYSAYLGLHDLLRTLPTTLSETQQQQYLEFALGVLVPPAATAQSDS